MISNVNFSSASQYVQAFGAKPTVKNTDNAISTTVENRSSQKEKIPQFISDVLTRVTYQNFKKTIGKIEKEIANDKNIVDYNDLECVSAAEEGKTAEEKIILALLNPEIYMLDGKPYTGYAHEKTKNGTDLFIKYKNGESVLTYMKNSKKGFSGYTDDENGHAEYYKSTPDKGILLSTINYAEGKTEAKIITVDKDGMSVKKYNTTGDIREPETQKLNAEVEKYFGNDLGDEYYIF